MSDPVPDRVVAVERVFGTAYVRFHSGRVDTVQDVSREAFAYLTDVLVRGEPASALRRSPFARQNTLLDLMDSGENQTLGTRP